MTILPRLHNRSNVVAGDLHPMSDRRVPEAVTREAVRLSIKSCLRYLLLETAGADIKLIKRNPNNQIAVGGLIGNEEGVVDKVCSHQVPVD